MVTCSSEDYVSGLKRAGLTRLYRVFLTFRMPFKLLLWRRPYAYQYVQYVNSPVVHVQSHLYCSMDVILTFHCHIDRRGKVTKSNIQSTLWTSTCVKIPCNTLNTEQCLVDISFVYVCLFVFVILDAQ